VRAFVIDADAQDPARRPLAALGEIARAYAEGHTIWLLLREKTEDASRFLEEALGVHPLTVEDVWGDRELPKAEEFPGYLQILVHTVKVPPGKRPAHAELLELDILVGDRFVVTHATDEVLTAPVEALLERNPRALCRGPAFVAHALLDHLVDEFVPLLDGYDETINTLEARIIAHAGTPEGRALLSQILHLKRGLQRLRRTTTYQRETLLRLSRGEFEKLPPETQPFFRDVYDHFARVTDLVDSYRELLTSLLEAYLSVQSNRMNEVMKALTLISTIMLPITFIAGVYGMNFEVMPELTWRLGYPWALGLMAVVTALIVTLFRRKKWV
jgi:magnesium transporter